MLGQIRHRVARAAARIGPQISRDNESSVADPVVAPPQTSDYRAAGILAHIDSDGLGLEIGPSHAPIAAKADGWNVRILDHKDQAELQKKYQGHGVDLDAIEPVDYVWSGQRYLDLVGDDRFDWIIGSHTIEHVADLVGFINESVEILTPGGVLALVIPDLRFCFDTLRPPSDLGVVVDSHLEARKGATPGQILEYYMNFAERGGRISWHPGDTNDLDHPVSVDDALGFYQRALDGEELDIHVWRFTPHSFRLLIAQLRATGLINVGEVFFSESPIGEFYIGLGLEGTDTSGLRLELSMKAKEELEGQT